LYLKFLMKVFFMLWIKLFDSQHTSLHFMIIPCLWDHFLNILFK
jgi:hypothetical protein